tara:strand:+ start:1059 stop:1322 length:264 start_codon:yes stop_codon:yes gene_type:complete
VSVGQQGTPLTTCPAIAPPQHSASQVAADLLIAAAQIERDRHSLFSEYFWHAYQLIASDDLGDDVAATLQSLSEAVTKADQAWGDQS